MKRVRAAAVATFLSMAAAGASAFVTSDAQASVSIAILFDDLVHDASAAAVATAVEQHAVWENGRIYTYTRLHVDTPVAGTLPADPWVRTLGGIVGKIGQTVEGEAVLTVGKTSLLFLQPQIYRDAQGETKAPNGMFEVTARAQGQFPVLVDAKNARYLIRANGVGALVAPPADRIARVTQIRAAAGVTAGATAGSTQGAPLAQDVLHNRPVSEATNEIVAVWSRLHAK